MRLRTDSPFMPGWKRAVLLGAKPDPRETEPRGEWDPAWLDYMDSGEEARLGDVWIIRSARGPDGHLYFHYGSDRSDWPIVGYVLTCPVVTCTQGVHRWDHAHDCPAHKGQECQQGAGRGCWTWTGSVEDGTLTGSPSLHAPTELGGCGFHGWMRDGVLS